MDIAEIARTHPGWFRLWIVASLLWAVAATLAQWSEIFPAASLRTSSTLGITIAGREFYEPCRARFGIFEPTPAQLRECITEFEDKAERARAFRKLKPFLVILLPPILIPLGAVGAVQISRWVKRGFDQEKAK